MGRTFLKKKIKIDVYECSVHFYISSAFDKDVNTICKKYGHKYPDGPEEGDDEGLVLSFDMSDYYMIINEVDLSRNSVGHEIYHLVSRILKERVIHDEEAGAWLCGMLSEHADKFFFKPKKPCGQIDLPSSKS